MQQTSRATARVIASGRRVACVEFSQADALVAGLRGGGGALDGVLNGAQFRIAVEHKLDRLAVAREEFLRDVGNGQLRWHLEAPGIRLQFRAHEAEQTRFAAAVLAGDRHLLAAKKAEGGAGKEQPRTAAY